ncbi:hypothetical protein B0H16DRAFT_1458812 [Mycena metata]|uniref:Uncharacterized protein n=1 Tax=Mycena metata TaxID=1033252 RepID=A0AAD7J0Z9_9AGAR|nr:hypothetical protein B0H16DRAFT_1458812 [Mycena metata]
MGTPLNTPAGTEWKRPPVQRRWRATAPGRGWGRVGDVGAGVGGFVYRSWSGREREGRGEWQYVSAAGRGGGGTVESRSSFSGSNVPSSPGFSAVLGFSCFGRSPLPIPALPAIRTPPNAGTGWARHGGYEERTWSRECGESGAWSPNAHRSSSSSSPSMPSPSPSPSAISTTSASPSPSTSMPSTSYSNLPGAQVSLSAHAQQKSPRRLALQQRHGRQRECYDSEVGEYGKIGEEEFVGGGYKKDKKGSTGDEKHMKGEEDGGARGGRGRWLRVRRCLLAGIRQSLAILSMRAHTTMGIVFIDIP